MKSHTLLKKKENVIVDKSTTEKSSQAPFNISATLSTDLSQMEMCVFTNPLIMLSFIFDRLSKLQYIKFE